MATKDVEYERRIEATMKSLNCNRAKAMEILSDDWAIDHDERLDWEPTEDEEKEMRKAAPVAADRKPRKKGGPRERKPDMVKREVIQRLFDAIKDQYNDVVVSNQEKTIDFTIGDETFTIDLKKHRPAKDPK